MIKLTDFGRDHWSLLAYIETCCVDSSGQLDQRRLRINEANGRGSRSNGTGWEPSFGTQCKTGIPDPNHDDLECLEDLEREGFTKTLSFVNLFIALTDKGIKTVAQIRAHKRNGGQFNTFAPVD